MNRRVARSQRYTRDDSDTDEAAQCVLANLLHTKSRLLARQVLDLRLQRDAVASRRSTAEKTQRDQAGALSKVPLSLFSGHAL